MRVKSDSRQFRTFDDQPTSTTVLPLNSQQSPDTSLMNNEQSLDNSQEISMQSADDAVEIRQEGLMRDSQVRKIINSFCSKQLFKVDY